MDTEDEPDTEDELDILAATTRGVFVILDAVELLLAIAFVLTDALVTVAYIGVTAFFELPLLELLLFELPPIGLTGSQSGVLAGVSVWANCLVFVVRVG